MYSFCCTLHHGDDPIAQRHPTPDLFQRTDRFKLLSTKLEDTIHYEESENGLGMLFGASLQDKDNVKKLKNHI